MKFNFTQYTLDIHKKLSYSFVPGKKLLDVGCGTCVDSYMFREKDKLDVYSTDIYKHENVDVFGLKFKTGSIFKLPYKDSFFDYAFLHDVLHHIDENGQKYSKHVEALKEIERVVKNGGVIIIVEGNRYNPIFYPHIVKMCGHNHFTQKYFKNLINSNFKDITYKFFECHVYPRKLYKLFKIYERFMERFVSKRFLAYNCAIIRVKKPNT